MRKTGIEWTEATWNPVTGCTPISLGCANCYARRFADKAQRLGIPKYKDGFKITIHPELFDWPLKIKTPKMIFVNSMSDLFHEQLPDDVILRIFEAMEKADWHIFQVLTKRSARMAEFSAKYYPKWPDHIWAGVTVEAGQYNYRIDHLRSFRASVHFISYEPLLSSVKPINLRDIEWVIVGGETGPNHRPMRVEWVDEIFEECRKAGVAFFFKQYAGPYQGWKRDYRGRIWEEYPAQAKKTQSC